jgi:uncharacterized protein with PIN domain
MLLGIAERCSLCMRCGGALVASSAEQVRASFD